MIEFYIVQYVKFTIRLYRQHDRVLHCAICKTYSRTIPPTSMIEVTVESVEDYTTRIIGATFESMEVGPSDWVYCIYNNS